MQCSIVDVFCQYCHASDVCLLFPYSPFHESDAAAPTAHKLEWTLLLQCYIDRRCACMHPRDWFDVSVIYCARTTGVLFQRRNYGDMHRLQKEREIGRLVLMRLMPGCLKFGVWEWFSSSGDLEHSSTHCEIWDNMRHMLPKYLLRGIFILRRYYLRLEYALI